jgi:diamine N-acetyltransferase
MIQEYFETKNHKKVQIRQLESADFGELLSYLQNLSPETKKRFGPHDFDAEAIGKFYQNPNIHQGFIGIDIETNKIVAYNILKIGFIEKDQKRFESYGIRLNAETDATFAPSIADDWQSMGLGDLMFRYILDILPNTPIKRIVLWGGVQADNLRAVRYYEKHGFMLCGYFERNGMNEDRIVALKN